MRQPEEIAHSRAPGEFPPGVDRLTLGPGDTGTGQLEVAMRLAVGSLLRGERHTVTGRLHEETARPRRRRRAPATGCARPAWAQRTLVLMPVRTVLAARDAARCGEITGGDLMMAATP